MVGTLCLGEALVDLVTEAPVGSLADARTFVPHAGGAVANVCVVAARHGARVALAGGAGDDAWGRWLRNRLVAEGVDVRHFTLGQGRRTPVAFVTVDGAGEPSYEIYAEGLSDGLLTLQGSLDQAVDEADALLLSSNSLVGEAERSLTMRARELALAAGRPVLFDPNLRLGRWESPAPAIAASMACVDGALLVRCNRDEARVLTGKPDPVRAAEALARAGARLAVITLGSEGAVLRGELSADAAGVDAQVLSTMGAGDTFMGVLLARLQATGFYPAAAAAGLADAAREAARATERWGAT